MHSNQRVYCGISLVTGTSLSKINMHGIVGDTDWLVDLTCCLMACGSSNGASFIEVNSGTDKLVSQRQCTPPGSESSM